MVELKVSILLAKSVAFSLAYILSGLHYIGPTLDLVFIILGHTLYLAYILTGLSEYF